jgi:hypothetical protein
MTFSLEVFLLVVIAALSVVVGQQVAIHLWRGRKRGKVATPYGPVRAPTDRELLRAIAEHPPVIWPYCDTCGIVKEWHEADGPTTRQTVGGRLITCPRYRVPPERCESRWESWPHSGHFQHECGLARGHSGECRCPLCSLPNPNKAA